MSEYRGSPLPDTAVLALNHHGQALGKEIPAATFLDDHKRIQITQEIAVDPENIPNLQIRLLNKPGDVHSLILLDLNACCHKSGDWSINALHPWSDPKGKSLK
jgi:hypothetical protein